MSDYISEIIFQSTLPLRGVTQFLRSRSWLGGISIHTPLAGSDQVRARQAERESISIHTPLAGSDDQGDRARRRFQISIYTPLAGSDPDDESRWEAACKISIHTPLAGSDQISWQCPILRIDFNPHSPCGE